MEESAYPLARETRAWYCPGMNFVAVKDHSLWFHVEIPLVVEKSVAARATALSFTRTSKVFVVNFISSY